MVQMCVAHLVWVSSNVLNQKIRNVSVLQSTNSENEFVLMYFSKCKKSELSTKIESPSVDIWWTFSSEQVATPSKKWNWIFLPIQIRNTKKLGSSWKPFNPRSKKIVVTDAGKEWGGVFVSGKYFKPCLIFAFQSRTHHGDFFNSLVCFSCPGSGTYNIVNISGYLHKRGFCKTSTTMEVLLLAPLWHDTNGSCRLAMFLAKLSATTTRDCRDSHVTVLVLVTLGNAIQMGSFLFGSCHTITMVIKTTKLKLENWALTAIRLSPISLRAPCFLPGQVQTTDLHWTIKKLVHANACSWIINKDTEDHLT